MRRTLKLLFVLALVPGGVLAQVAARHPESGRAQDLRSAVAALERSRAALLQAREAVDAALLDVEETLRSVNAMAALARSYDFMPAAEVPVAPWLKSLSEASANVRSALNERFSAYQPAVEQLRWAACQALARRELAQDKDESPPGESSTDPRQEPGSGSTVAAQPALLREEDVRPFSSRAVAGEPIPRDEASVAAEAPLPPVSNPTASLPEVATDRDLAGTSACVEPAVVTMPALSNEVEPALPLAAASN